MKHIVTLLLTVFITMPAPIRAETQAEINARRKLTAPFGNQKVVGKPAKPVVSASQYQMIADSMYGTWVADLDGIHRTYLMKKLIKSTVVTNCKFSDVTKGKTDNLSVYISCKPR